MSKNFEKPKDYYSERREILPFVPKGKKSFLDVGCGEGAFGALLKRERRAEVWGIEIDPVVANKASEELDRVIVGDIEGENMGLPERYFDCIIFNDCLEHLYDPWRVLENVKKYLNLSGVIVASLPNVRYYEVIRDLLRYGKWRYAEQGVLDKTHLRFFTAESIKEMFEECGYTLGCFNGINQTRLPLLMCCINLICKGYFDDMRYRQFVCVAIL